MQVELVLSQLQEEGGFAFLKKDAQIALDRVRQACPRGFAMLTENARQSLTGRFIDRLSMPYGLPLVRRVQDTLMETDPLEAIRSTNDPEVLRTAVCKVVRELGDETGNILTERYPLLPGYVERITDNYVLSQSALLERLLEKKEEISEKLLAGRSFARIMDLTGDAGDIHRHGQCVQRVVTDAGTCYYKPHDLRLDELLHAVVRRWFSDSIVSAAVVAGDGYGFVEELKPAPLSGQQEPGEYYYHFGILTALFHALGSTDMHHENILAIGTRPAAIDLETLLKGKPSNRHTVFDNPARTFTKTDEELENCIESTGVLPQRLYKSGMTGVLFCEDPDSPCQPFRGKTRYSVSGYEKPYMDGFRDGYRRILENREALRELVAGYKQATVRYVPRNTLYYYVMRAMLFSPDALSGEAGQAKVLHRLRVAYDGMKEESMEQVVSYEAGCLMEGDIPYYCCAIDGYDLCGCDPEETVLQDYWAQSARERFLRKMERLSEAEAGFELDMIRASLSHAPCLVDETGDAREMNLPEDTAVLSAAAAAQLCRSIWDDLIRDRILTSDGTPIWRSGLQKLYMDHTLGHYALQADAACYAGTLLGIPALQDIHPEAAGYAAVYLRSIAKLLDVWEQKEDEELRRVFPLDEEGGLGCLIRAFAVMHRAQIDGAGDALGRILRLAGRAGMVKDHRRPQGETGLLLELCAAQDTCGQERGELSRLIQGCAEEVLAAERPDKPDQIARRAQALASAYISSGDERLLTEAQESFRMLLRAYQPQMPGWGDPSEELKWITVPGKAEAAIGRRAYHVFRGKAAAEEAEQVHALALAIVKNRGTLLREDTLRKGNAAAVMYLTEVFADTADPGCIDAAGRILAAMVSRREQTGAFICSPPGIRSFFDASIYPGSLGVGMAAAAYLRSREEIR